MLRRLDFAVLTVMGVTFMTALTLIVFRIQYTLYDPQYGEIFNYQWLQFVRTSELWVVFAIVAGTLAIVVLGMLTTIRLKCAVMILFAVLLDVICGGLFFIVLSTSAGTIFRPIESIVFNGRTYHLTQVTTADLDWDTAVSSFIVYECDLTSSQCQVRKKDIDQSYLGGNRMGKFIVDELQHALYVQTYQEKILIDKSGT